MDKLMKKWMYIVHAIFVVLLILSALYFVYGEMFTTVEKESGVGTVTYYDGSWNQVMADGTRKAVSIPGNCEAQKGDVVTVETVLPENQQDIYFCIRSLQQDIKVFVGDELREEYSTLDTQRFGKTSTIAYVFIPIYEEDAGATLTIQFMSDSAYYNYLGSVMMGDKSDIWSLIIRKFGPGTIVGCFIFILSVTVIIFSLIARYFYRRKVELLDLGAVLLIASTWIMAESRLRQFLLPDSTVAMQIGFLMIILMPFPCGTYMNKVQNGRYEKLYVILCTCTVVNFVYSVTLQLLNIKDFFETMTISHVLIVTMIAAMGITILIDLIKGRVKEYKEVAIGYLGLMASGMWEINLVYRNDSDVNGIPMSFGLVFLLFMAGMKTLRDTLNIEKEKQSAIAASESKANFLANMSHEIRTPINTVIGMNEMILRENKDDTINEYAQNIENASQMLLSIINDVLEISKIEAGKIQIVESEYQLASMIHNVIMGIKPRADKKNLKIVVEADEHMPSVLCGDEIRIKQVLNNLLSNAVKYTEEGTVTFSAKGMAQGANFVLAISIKDTGIGIKKEDVNKLFNSFIRLELNKNRCIEGTGLGLCITKQLVENMKGEITVESEYGKGSCFTVLLPQKIVDATCIGNIEEKYRNVREHRTVREHLRAPGKKLLVVDDNDMNLKVMGALLKNTQIELDFATGGNECLKICKDKKYDLILMDHMMPEPDGIQTLHMLRADSENVNRHTRVIVLTANAIEGVTENYKNEGFDGYLSKPVDAELLEKTLSDYLFEEADL